MSQPDFSKGGRIEVVGPDGFRMIPDTMLFSLNIQPLDIRIYGILLWYAFRANHLDRRFPGRRELAGCVGVKSLRTIDSALERLQNEGYLAITPTFNPDGSQGYNHYTLHFAPLPADQRQRRTKRDISGTSEATEGGCNELHGGGKTSANDGVQQIAPGGEGATDCTPRGATDCTPPVQQAAHLIRNKNQKEKKEEPDSFANAQESAAEPDGQQAIDGMPGASPPSGKQPAGKPKTASSGKAAELPPLTSTPESREQASPYAKRLANEWIAHLKQTGVLVIDRGAKADGSTSRTFWSLVNGLFTPALLAGATERQIKEALVAAFKSSGNTVPPWSSFERSLHTVQGTHTPQSRTPAWRTNLHVGSDEAGAELQRMFEEAL